MHNKQKLISFMFWSESTIKSDSGAINSLKVQELKSLINVMKTHERLAASQYNLQNHKR